MDEDDDPSNKESAVIDDFGDEHSEDERRHKAKPKKRSFDKSWQENYSCMSKHDGTGKPANPNARTIEVLQQMADYYERQQDHWRLTAYRRAISALRNQDRKITTEEEAFAIPFIGQRVCTFLDQGFLDVGLSLSRDTYSGSKRFSEIP